MADISVQDITNALQIIDECARRGSFQGNEMASVGSVRDKLAAFVDANTETPEVSTEEETVQPPEPPVEEETVEDIETVEVDVNDIIKEEED